MFDLVPGPASSSPRFLTPLGTSRLLFAANTPATGIEVFMFDVTTGLVTLVADLEPGENGIEISKPAACNGRVFVGVDETLYATDGDVFVDLGSFTFPMPDVRICIGGTQLLLRDGPNLLKSDGTVAGTSVVAAFQALEFAILGDKVFMHDGAQLRSIGTDLAGALVTVDTGILSQFQSLVTFGTPARLFFGASGGSSGLEPYASDVTGGNAVLLADLGPGDSMTDIAPVVVGNAIYFVAAGQLFKSNNGATPVTVLPSPTPVALAAAGAKVIVRETSATDSLRVIDAANDMVNPLCDAPTVLFPTLSSAAGRVYFVARSSSTALEEFWVTDGTGCTQLKDLAVVATFSSSPSGFAAIGSTVLFHAGTVALGRELYRTKSPFSSTELVKDIKVGTSGGFVGNERFVAMGAKAFFAADDGVNGVELWMSDGTTGGTQEVVNLAPSSASSSPQALVAIGTTLLFSADADGGLGRELYSFVEGAGVNLVLDIRSGSASSSPSGFTAVGSDTFFFATIGADRRLHVLRGGAVTLVSAASSVTVENSATIAVLGDQLFFPATGAGTGVELAIFDISDDNLVIKDLAAGSANSNPNELVVSGSSVFFHARTASGRELWRSQGPDATAIVLDFNPGPANGIPFSPMLVAFNGGVLVAATTTATGDEPVFVDASGSMIPLKDIEPGPPSSEPELVAVDGAVAYLSAGRELWRTDGTAAGTVLVEDIFTGPEASDPSAGIVVNGVILFAATDEVHDRELFKITHVCDTAEVATTCATGTYGIALEGGGQVCLQFNGGDELASSLDAAEIGPCDVVVTGGGADSAFSATYSSCVVTTDADGELTQFLLT
ncbi:MAG: hypothetical protein IV100_28575, partial [Myxococcales bacterium]|nr:hypothetical protein [Myxococcales bacterium]